MQAGRTRGEKPDECVAPTCRHSQSANPNVGQVQLLPHVQMWGHIIGPLQLSHGCYRCFTKDGDECHDMFPAASCDNVVVQAVDLVM